LREKPHLPHHYPLPQRSAYSKYFTLTISVSILTSPLLLPIGCFSLPFLPYQYNHIKQPPACIRQTKSSPPNTPTINPGASLICDCHHNHHKPFRQPLVPQRPANCRYSFQSCLLPARKCRYDKNVVAEYTFAQYRELIAVVPPVISFSNHGSADTAAVFLRFCMSP
jgi:hypothetical protein